MNLKIFAHLIESRKFASGLFKVWYEDWLFVFNTNQHLIRHTMKKLLTFLTIAMMFAMIFYSCKGHELCPAYGKANSKSKTEKHA
jgi:hypothetical protein